MDTPSSPGLRGRVPVLTLLIACCAVAATLIPGWSAWLIYDRSAILSGQFWRMLTWAWVHFSGRHLAYDLTAWCVAGWIIETRGLPRFGWICILTPCVLSAVMLVFEPRMRFCGGLSGLDVAAFVYLSLHGLAAPPPWRWCCWAALAALAGKLFFELANGRSLFDTLNGVPVASSVTSHVAGAAAAAVFYWGTKPARGSPQSKR